MLLDSAEAQDLRDSTRESYERLRAIVAAQGSAIVAFSGGVDSALVLKVAVDVLGSRAVALTAISPSVAPREREAARRIAAEIGAAHVLVHSSELDDPEYARNPEGRCYFCKTELYDLCRAAARERGLATVLDGFNADDAGGHRPGRRAGEEHGVVSPLLLAGMHKPEIRAWSLHLGLSTWDKPQLACLASRIPHGTPITEAMLAQVARAEEALADLGLAVLRVRHHGDVARIELGEAELARVLSDASLRERAVAGVKAAGYRFVALDLEPFRSGRLSGPARAGATLPVVC